MSRISTIFIMTLLVVSLAATASTAKPFVFETEATVTGQINKDLVTGDTSARTDLQAAWGLIQDTEWRGYLDFDTTPLDGLRFPEIVSVEFVYGPDMTLIGDNPPPYFQAGFFTSECMADGLGADDWDAGTFAASHIWYDYFTPATIDLGEEGMLALWNFDGGAVRFDPPEHYTVTLRNIGQGDFSTLVRHCKLRITYYKRAPKSAEEVSPFGSVKALFR